MKRIIIIALFVGTACSKQDAPLQVEATFQLLNEAGQSTTVFSEGENFQFLFVIRNKTVSQLNFSPDFMGDDFFRVFRSEQGGFVSMGKPYQNAFCQFGVGQFIIAPGEEYRFNIPWVPEDGNNYYPFCLTNKNDPLSKGKYRTAIEKPIHVTYEGGAITIAERFVIDFEIK